MLIDDIPSIGEMDNLGPPLIPTVDSGVDVISDIYCVGKISTKRWRGYIDCKNWDPRQYHDHLLVVRAYNARVCWETCNYLAISESNWLSLGSIKLIQLTAHYRLRMTEFEIVSFQLSCGMLGIKTDDHDRLFRCCIAVFTTMVFYNRIILGDGEKNKERRRASIELEADLRPYSVDSVKQLGGLIDKNIFTIVAYMKNTEELMAKDEKNVEILNEKLKNCILMLDDLLHIV